MNFRCVMDFPGAWAFVARTRLAQHHGKCSYRVTARGMLCDCSILEDEYKRRKKPRATNSTKEGEPHE